MTFTREDREKLKKIKDRINYAYESGRLKGLTLADFREVENCYSEILESENYKTYTLFSKVKDVFQNAGFKIFPHNVVNYEISLR